VEGGGSSGEESGSVTCSVESSLALAPLIESVRSELARGRSRMVKFLGIVVSARSSIITHKGGDSIGTDGCAEGVSCVPRDIKDTLWLSVVCVEGGEECTERLDRLKDNTYLL
jgi:hypothetical protein